jgi:hypothetical protein
MTRENEAPITPALERNLKNDKRKWSHLLLL